MLIERPPAEIAENLWMLGTAPYPLYFVLGQREAAIFEGGVSAMGPVLREQLDELGIDAQTVRQVIVTHGHPDHVMAVPQLRRMFPKATVLASAAAARTLANEKAIALFCQIDAALGSALEAASIVAPRHRAEPLAEARIAVDRTIEEGDTIAVGGTVFQVLETPGHSDCSLSFYEPERRVLLISDATGYYLPQYDCFWPNYFADYAAYVRSMERLAALPCETLCLSHNAVIQGAEDVAAYFRAAIYATTQYHERILDETAAGHSVRQIAEQLGAEVFEKTQLLPLDFFQKNCALLVKHSLRHEGLGADKGGAGSSR